MTPTLGQLALVLGGTAFFVALAIVWLVRAGREADPGRVSEGWRRRARAAVDEGKEP